MPAPICRAATSCSPVIRRLRSSPPRSEEHTSELQSQSNLVCRLLLEKKKTGRRHILQNQRGAHFAILPANDPHGAPPAPSRPPLHPLSSALPPSHDAQTHPRPAPPAH